jgi:hypothetical protein
MEWPLVTVLVTCFLGLVIIGASNAVFSGIVQEVNAVSPQDQRVNPWRAGWSFYRVFRRHRELFPQSRKRSKMGWLSAIGSLLLFGAMIFGVLATNAGWIKN